MGIIVPIAKGDASTIVKKCLSCEENKHYSLFPRRKSKGKGKSDKPNRRKTNCIECTKIYQSNNQDILIKSYLEKNGIAPSVLADFHIVGKLHNTTTDASIANKEKTFFGLYNNGLLIKRLGYRLLIRYLREGSCEILKDYPFIFIFKYPVTLESLKPYILKRDNFLCQYCGNRGNVIDHKEDSTLGGLNTPLNCVCSCEECIRQRKKLGLSYTQFINYKRLNKKITYNKNGIPIYRT
ncbi:HNH endonuclease signature motif containing protein [Priestia megaterium]|uniref:HNH endonuclease n=1 Tax=Priestia megaterium TaxID=1404 RepID=UPI002E2076B0|nr:HNH endonuclease signature motif containing protein [Priestia megaterium]